VSGEREKHINRLKIAEQQFRLACAVRLAISNGVQPLDVPVEWTFGAHRVSYEDFGLRFDQAPLAAKALAESAMFILVCTILDAIKSTFPNPKAHSDPKIVTAYQISRIIRNAFAHSAVEPYWNIDRDCANTIFSIDGVISIDTAEMSGRRIGWRDYGGPLAIFYFGRFVREVLLQDPIDPNRTKPAYPSLECYQQGPFILRKVGELPNGAVEQA
jgi:hypothetical protein